MSTCPIRQNITKTDVKNSHLPPDLPIHAFMIPRLGSEDESQAATDIHRSQKYIHFCTFHQKHHVIFGKHSEKIDNFKIEFPNLDFCQKYCLIDKFAINPTTQKYRLYCNAEETKLATVHVPDICSWFFVPKTKTSQNTWIPTILNYVKLSV